jgi:hypothetical protein
MSNVAQRATEEGRNVASTVAEQTGEVAAEAGAQARNLMEEGKDQLRTQVEAGQRKAVAGLHDMAAELRRMSDGSEDSGLVSQLARQTTDQVERAASWLDERRPGDLVDEVRRFARRRPGMFLSGAVIAGVLVGRLTRNAMSTQHTDRPDGSAGRADRPMPASGMASAGPASPGTPFAGSIAGAPDTGAGMPDTPTTGTGTMTGAGATMTPTTGAPTTAGATTGAGAMRPLDGEPTERIR